MKCKHGHNECNECGCGTHFKPLECAPIPCGYSPEEQIQHLNARCNTLAHEVNKVLEKGEGALDRIQNVACANGAFYSDHTVKVEQGYSADDGTTYSITTVNPSDRACRPVTVRLATAYGDSTNSGAKQSLFDAGQFQLANIASNATEGSRLYGHTIVDGVPLPSEKQNELFCYGFTRRGVMKAYSNAIDKEQFNKDNVRYLVGCEGIIIENGAPTTEGYTTRIPKRNVKSSKSFMGQNYETGQTFFLVCGDNSETENGMTVDTATNILLQYGCNVAVYTAGASSDLLDKGGSVIVPDDNTVPEVLAYWYVSKKKCFSNDYQVELARLTYLVQMSLSRIKLVEKDNGDIKDKIKDIVADLENVNNMLTNHEDRIKELEDCCKLVNDMLTALENKLDKEIQDRINGDKVLQQNVDKEIQDRKDADDLLREEIETTIGSLELIKQMIADEKVERIAGDEALQTQITDTKNKLTTLRNDFDIYTSTNDLEIQDLKQKNAELLVKIDNALLLLAELQAQFITYDNWVIEINKAVANVESVLMALKIFVDTIDVRLKVVEDTYIQSVTGDYVDNSDPQNPFISIPELPKDYVISVKGNVVDNSNPRQPVVTAVKTVKGSAVDNSDPLNPIINIPDTSGSIPTKFVESVTGTAVAGTAKNPIINLQEIPVKSVTGTAVTGTAENPVIDLQEVEKPTYIAESVAATVSIRNGEGGTTIKATEHLYRHGSTLQCSSIIFSNNSLDPFTLSTTTDTGVTLEISQPVNNLYKSQGNAVAILTILNKDTKAYDSVAVFAGVRNVTLSPKVLSQYDLGDDSSYKFTLKSIEIVSSPRPLYTQDGTLITLT